MGKYLKHPLGQAVLVFLVSYLLLDFGIEYIPPLLGWASAPIPNSVLLQYLITVGVGILLWVSDNDARWAEFKAPMHRVMVDPGQKTLRNSLMVLVPVLVAFATFNSVRPSVSAPTTLRAMHGSLELSPAGVVVADPEEDPHAHGDEILKQHRIRNGSARPSEQRRDVLDSEIQQEVRDQEDQDSLAQGMLQVLAHRYSRLPLKHT